VEIAWRGRTVRIEHAWLNPGAAGSLVVVFLHEGLGSLAMWRDFPQQLCTRLGMRGLMYSRPGYGQSTPRAPDEPWGVDFMHRQAFEVLPALLQALAIDPARERLWLFGHSDGGSIALLYASQTGAQLTGAVVLAPHIMVEDMSVDSIEQARIAYQTTDLKQRLAKYHQDPDSAFWGWNNIWLQPAFRDWSIENELPAIRCPLLAVQGVDDEYGSMAQIRGIAQRVPGTQLLELTACGHSPHRDQPQTVIDATAQFIHNNTPGDKP
jgi:pimeloyl-ACP methyl ester carboxylesterase